MSKVIRISDKAEEYFCNQQKENENMKQTVDRILDLDGKDFEERVEQIAERKARAVINDEVVEEALRDVY
jgi:hypothetical protein